MLTLEQVEQMQTLSSDFVTWIYKHESAFKVEFLIQCEIIESITVCGNLIYVRYIDVDSVLDIQYFTVDMVLKFLKVRDSLDKYC